MRVIALGACTLGFLFAFGCAHSERSQHAGRDASAERREDSPGGARGENRGGQLFVSPAGEPFGGRSAGPGLELWFQAADQDGDGALTAIEMRTQALRFFARLDANQNGAVTPAETSALWYAEAPQILSGGVGGPPLADSTPRSASSGDRGGSDRGGGGGRGGGKDGDHGGGGGARDGRAGEAAGQARDEARESGPEGPARFGLLPLAEPVVTCDQDYNRQVSAAEFAVCAEARFAQLDANQDGRFTLDEARARLPARQDNRR